MKLARTALFGASCLVFAGAIALAQSTATPAPKATPTASPFTYSGQVRGYYFTRGNASGYPQSAGQINQATYNTGISLHGAYQFENSPFSVAGTYFYANPLNGNCETPQSHLTQPCAKHTGFQQVNPDDTLPGFVLSSLIEAYVQYKEGPLTAKLGDQVSNTPWTNLSDSRLKPSAFEGGDATYAFDKMWTGEVAYFDRFEGRSQSAFQNTTLLTSHTQDVPGIAGNIFTPGGTALTNSGLGYARLGYTGPKANGTQLVGNLHYYAFTNIANAFWLDGKYTLPGTLKPFVAIQGGAERNAGSELIGKIVSDVFGVQIGVTPAPGFDLTLGYDDVPQKTDTIVLPAGVSCNGKNQIANNAGVTFPYFLPSGGTTNCHKNSDGTTNVYYGGWASPYTDGYATDVLFTTSISQGMIDRRSPGQAVKLAGTLLSTDKKWRLIASRAWYLYGNATAGVSPTQELDIDGTYFFNRVPKSGPYHGLSLRHRYAERNQQFTEFFGGTPVFKYNRTQLQFDF